MAKKKSILEKAMEVQNKDKDRVVSIEKNRIHTIRIVDGKERIVIYQDIDNCMSCGERRLVCGETVNCPVCDGLMTDKEYSESRKEETKVEIVSNPPKAAPKITKEEMVEEEFPIQVIDASNLPEIPLNLPTKEEVLAWINMYKFVTKELIEPGDRMKIGKKEFIKKSGWRRFVRPFSISLEVTSEEIIELKDDVYAKAKARAILPNGQFVEGIGIKSKSEYWSEKYKNFGNYNLHNLITTAITRAKNRAISDLVAYGEVSAEEIQSRSNTEEDGKIEDAFG